MDKATRGELLRQRYRAKAGTKLLVPRREPKNPSTRPTGGFWRNWPTNYAPTGEVAAGNDVEWIELPDPKPKPTVKPKRTKRVSALVRIAKQSGKKLVRTYRTAEAMLAERARQ
jgi:hypothetical protein